VALVPRQKIKGRRLSPHFTEDEFACPCCGMILVDPELVRRLERLRHMVGGKPIHINSGYRCTKHNNDVGGVSNSQHLFGRAADIVIYGLSPRKVLYSAADAGFDGIGLYSTFTHVDVRGYKVRWSG